MEAHVNHNITSEGDRMHTEYKYIEKWLKKDGDFLKGIDVGCGTNRLSDRVLSLDVQPNNKYAHADIVWDCKDLEIFHDGVLDFVFSSHVLEDFEDIPAVFMKWWKKIKADGLMILLLPDMQAGRYPKIDERDDKGKLKGNPSHRTNVGREYMESILKKMDEEGKIKYKMEQVDTIPHNETCSIDVVIRKLK